MFDDDADRTVVDEDPDDAEHAVNDLNNKEMSNGKNLYVGRAQKKAEREAEMKRKSDLLKLERINRSQGVNLYVKNLEDTINLMLQSSLNDQQMLERKKIEQEYLESEKNILEIFKTVQPFNDTGSSEVIFGGNRNRVFGQHTLEFRQLFAAMAGAFR